MIGVNVIGFWFGSGRHQAPFNQANTPFKSRWESLTTLSLRMGWQSIAEPRGFSQGALPVSAGWAFDAAEWWKGVRSRNPTPRS